eukprot:scaffold146028_cov18-Tisochrysis_lutea.AAC.1
MNLGGDIDTRCCVLAFISLPAGTLIQSTKIVQGIQKPHQLHISMVCEGAGVCACVRACARHSTKTILMLSCKVAIPNYSSTIVAAFALACLLQLSRLYKHKLEHVLQSLRTTVCRCAHCGAMYSSANAHRLSCAAGTKLQAAQ